MEGWRKVTTSYTNRCGFIEGMYDPWELVGIWLGKGIGVSLLSVWVLIPCTLW